MLTFSLPLRRVEVLMLVIAIEHKVSGCCRWKWESAFRFVVVTLNEGDDYD